MARPGITYQDVATAALELKGQGKNPTIEGIRAVLGTGSIGTINNHLRKWKEVQTATLGITSKENLPDSLILLIKSLWEGVLTQSSEKFLPIEGKYQQEILELKNELTKYKDNNQRWQKMYNQWQQEKTSLANEKLTLEQTLDFTHKENQSLHAKYDGLIQRLQEKQARVDELHQLHQQTQRNLEHYRETTREQRLLDQQQFEQQKQQLVTEIKILKEETAVQRQKMTELQQKKVSLSEAHQFLEKNYLQSHKENEQLKVKNSLAEKKSHEYFISCETYQHHNKELLKTIADQSNQLINHQAENKILSNKIDEKTKELNMAKDQLKLLSQEKLILAQEKAQVEGQLNQIQKMIV